eukprot:GHRR01026415.1.p1 GENE.GHRR01026415.1~~GHRR01026415.1.p1  ORF type:complete len:211 (+),score=73.98 GHRR01026415.1:28-633(+)
MTTPAAARLSLPVLLGNRAVMGAGEGVTFPSVQSIVKGWVPADTRTRALTLIYSGGQLGTIVALVTAPIIIKAFGWPAVFEIYGSLGLFWMVAWQNLVSHTPPLSPQNTAKGAQPSFSRGAQSAALPSATDSKSVSEQQRQPHQSVQQQQQHAAAQSGAVYTQQDSSSAGSLSRFQDIPFKQFFTNRAFVAIVMAHSAFGR